jgi:hypothetical protein
MTNWQTKPGAASAEAREAPIESSTHGVARSPIEEIGITAALTLLIVVLWALRHRYAGIVGDAQLYAFQALALLHPALATDLALQGNSQDHYTLFPPLYALAIEHLGVAKAAATFWVGSMACLLGAAWFVVRAVSDRLLAFLSIALMSTVLGTYGSAGVFHYSENFFTARLVAEALVVTALACQLHQNTRLALIIAGVAMLVHPLMALPGLLLVLGLMLPMRWAVIGAAAGILASVALAVAALSLSDKSPLFTLMDPEWLEVVRERSQFLFLDLWSVADWELNARPFLSLALTYAAVTHERMTKLSGIALLVGGTGLAVAWIAGIIGPSAILVQGQAWRWVWITNFIGVVLLVPTAAHVWKDEHCGSICALLLVSAWTFDQANAPVVLLLALAAWVLRYRITPPIARLLDWAALAGAAGMTLWSATKIWAIATGPLADSTHEHEWLQKIHEVFELGVPSVLFAALVAWATLGTRKTWLPPVVCAGLLACLLALLPFDFLSGSSDGTPAQIREFSDWERVIPPTRTVYIPGNKDNGHFVWLTLGRPNYLSSDQSAGVVFSRALAMEIKRRASVLLPVEDPDWKILTRIRLSRAQASGKEPRAFRPLTAESLWKICRDPLLGFVASPENVGFEPLRHAGSGTWNGWNLYDCEHVRSTMNLQ